MLNNEIIKWVTTIIKIMKLNCRELWKKFQRYRLNISIQRWIIPQYQKWLSDGESKFIRLFDKSFKIIKNCVLTRMENMTKFKRRSSHNIKSDSLRRSLNLLDSLTRVSKSSKLALSPIWEIWSNAALCFGLFNFSPVNG